MRTRPPRVTCLIFLLLTSSSAGWAWQGTQQPAQSEPAPLTNADVLEMLKSGISADIVAAKIKNTNSRLDTSPATLKNLKIGGVPDSVLLAMVQAPSNEKAVPVSSETQVRDFVPLLQSLAWPVLVLILLIAWKSKVTALLDAVLKRIQSRATVEFWGFVLREPQDEAYKPYP